MRRLLRGHTSSKSQKAANINSWHKGVGTCKSSSEQSKTRFDAQHGLWIALATAVQTNALCLNVLARDDAAVATSKRRSTNTFK